MPDVRLYVFEPKERLALLLTMTGHEADAFMPENNDMAALAHDRLPRARHLRRNEPRSRGGLVLVPSLKNDAFPMPVIVRFNSRWRSLTCASCCIVSRNRCCVDRLKRRNLPRP